MLEKVQQRAIRMITNLKGRCYEDRLRELRLTTLKERRMRGDMYRVMTGRIRWTATCGSWGLPRGKELPQQDRPGDTLMWKYLSKEDYR